MIDDKQLISKLLATELIDQKMLRKGLGLAEKYDTSLYETLIYVELVDESEMVELASTILNVPSVHLTEAKIDGQTAQMISGEMAASTKTIPVEVVDDGGMEVLKLAMSNPIDVTAMDEVARHTGIDIQPVLAGPVDIDAAIERLYGSGGADEVIELDEVTFKLGSQTYIGRPGQIEGWDDDLLKELDEDLLEVLDDDWFEKEESEPWVIEEIDDGNEVDNTREDRACDTESEEGNDQSDQPTTLGRIEVKKVSAPSSSFKGAIERRSDQCGNEDRRHEPSQAKAGAANGKANASPVKMRTREMPTGERVDLAEETGTEDDSSSAIAIPDDVDSLRLLRGLIELMIDREVVTAEEVAQLVEDVS